MQLGPCIAFKLAIIATHSCVHWDRTALDEEEAGL